MSPWGEKSLRAAQSVVDAGCAHGGFVCTWGLCGRLPRQGKKRQEKQGKRRRAGGKTCGVHVEFCSTLHSCARLDAAACLASKGRSMPTLTAHSPRLSY